MATENKYQKSIDRLNQAIGKEIATTLQYLYFHVHFEDDGYEYFSKMMKQTSITEMFHTDKIADRILFLQGEVEMMPSFEPRKIRDVKEALEFSMTLEQRTVDSYNEWARLCAAEDDPDHAQAFPGSRQRGGGTSRHVPYRDGEHAQLRRAIPRPAIDRPQQGNY